MKHTSINRQMFDRFAGDERKIAPAVRGAFYNTFNSEDGELVLLELMRFAEMNGLGYKPAATAEDFAFVEGKRAVVHRIMQLVEMTEIDILAKKKARKNK